MTSRSGLSLYPDLSNLVRLESFIRECSFLDGAEMNHALLVATEYFDNIARYSKYRVSRPVSIRVTKKDGVVIIAMKYATNNFLEMVRAADTTTPWLDAEVGRYRGLGLRMCRNLSSRIRYKKGLFKSSITIIL